MILEANMGAILSKVFTVYAVFWVVVITTLFFGIGALMKKRERQLEQRKHGHH